MNRFRAILTLPVFLSTCRSFETSPSSFYAEPNSQLTISGPWTQLIYHRHQDVFDPINKNFESEYLPVEITYGAKSIKAEIRNQGGVRFCDSFPHYKLKLLKSEKLFEQKEFKVISHGFFTSDKNLKIDAAVCGNKFNSTNFVSLEKN